MPLEIFRQFNMFEEHSDSIKLAQTYSEELYQNPLDLPSENEVHSVIFMLNLHLANNNGNIPSVISATTAYLDLPNDRSSEIAELPTSEIERARVEQATVQGQIRRFYWFGSIAMTAIGVEVDGVELLAPEHRYHTTAFIPVTTIVQHRAA